MPIAKSQVYKCSVCGNEVEVLFAGGGTLVCCDKPMDRMAENTTDAAQEKHVPVVEKVDGGIKVTVGEVPHPMEEKHHISWIEVIADGRSCRRFFSPGDAPEAMFGVKGDSMITVRAYCNLHGLWKAA